MTKSNHKDVFSKATEAELIQKANGLKETIKRDGFDKVASSGDMDLKALRRISDEVKTNAEGARPKFDLIVSPDPLTLRVVNRLYEPLKKMGFDPVLIFGTYRFPSKMNHPDLAEFSWQNELFNTVIIQKLDHDVRHEGHFMTPGNLRRVSGVKVIDQVDSLNDRNIIDYVRSPSKNVGIANLFRLYEKISPEFISLYKDPAGTREAMKHKTHFRNGPDDDGMRSSLLTNIHPSLTDHGVIPPFWTQLRMLQLMDKLKIDYKQKTVEEVAKICLDNGVDPYLHGMIHHVEQEFDTGDIIIPGQNYTPVDLNKTMWENYFAMEEFIVDSILATAAAYKLGYSTKGLAQDFSKTLYHSYPGEDSRPPLTMPAEKRKEIKDRDKNALTEFVRLGGKLSSWDHFEKIVFGDPANGTPGFVLRGSSAAANLKERLERAKQDRELAMGICNDNNPPGKAPAPPPLEGPQQ